MENFKLKNEQIESIEQFLATVASENSLDIRTAEDDSLEVRLGYSGEGILEGEDIELNNIAKRIGNEYGSRYTYAIISEENGRYFLRIMKE